MIKTKEIISIAVAILFFVTSITSSIIVGEEVKEDPFPPISFNPKPKYSPESYNFGNIVEGDKKFCSFEIWNNRCIVNETYIYRDLYWEINMSKDMSVYLTVSPLNDTSPAGELSGGFDAQGNPVGDLIFYKTVVNVMLDSSGLKDGFYSFPIQIDFYDCIFEDKVFMSHENFDVEFSIGPVLGISKSYFDFGRMGKNQTKTDFFQIYNSGHKKLNYSLSLTDNSGWITINPTIGSVDANDPIGDLIFLNIDTTGLDYDKYYCEISIDSNGGSDLITVDLDVTGAVLMYAQHEEYDWAFDNLDDNEKVFTLGTIYRGGDPNDPDDDGIYTVSFDIWNDVPGLLRWEVFLPGLLGNNSLNQSYISLSIDGNEPAEYGNNEIISGISTGPDDVTTVNVTINTNIRINPIPSQYKAFLGEDNPYACRLGSHGLIRQDLPTDYICIDSNDEKSKRPGDFGPNGMNPYYEYRWFRLDYYLSACDPSEKVDMVIVTTDALLDSPMGDSSCKYSLYDLAEAHEVIDGFNVKIKTVNEIYKEYHDYRSIGFCYYNSIPPYLFDDDDLVRSFDVREFLRDACMQWGTEYVLLVGDDDWKMKEINVINGAIENEYFIAELGYGRGFNGMYKHHAAGNSEEYYNNLDSKFLKKDYVDYWDPLSGLVGNILDIINDAQSLGCVDMGDGTIQCTPVEEVDMWDKLWAEYSNEVPTFQVPTDTSSYCNYNYNLFTTASDRPYSCLGVESRYKYNYFTGFNQIVYQRPVYNETGKEIPGLHNTFDFRYVKLSDRSSDVYVGRAPADTPQDVSNFVEKTIKYMVSNDDEYHNAVLLSEYLGRKSHITGDAMDLGANKRLPIDYEGDDNPAICESLYPGPSCLSAAYPLFTDDLSRAIIDKFDPYDYIPDLKNVPYFNGLQEYLEYYLKGNSNSLEWIDLEYGGNIDTRGIPSEYFNIIELKDTTSEYADPDEPCFGVNRWSGDDLTNLMNQGVGIINHIGTADRESDDWFQICGLFYSPKTGEFSRDLRLSPTLSNLDNTVYPIVYSTGDYGGMFDNGKEGYICGQATRGKSMGELLLFGADFCGDSVTETKLNGCVAGIFNSIAMPGDEYHASLYNRMFWDNVFGEDGNGRVEDVRVGQAFHEAQSESNNANVGSVTAIFKWDYDFPPYNNPIPVTYKYSNGKYNDYYYYGLNLLGDPALKIKGSKNIEPKAILIDTAQNAREIPVGSGVGFLSESYDPDGEIVNLEWEFSEGIILEGPPDDPSDVNPEPPGEDYPERKNCIFTKTGPNIVKITVTDNNGAKSSFSKKVYVVNGSNLPPVISSESLASGSTDVSVDLDSLSVDIVDPEGDSFDWIIFLRNDDTGEIEFEYSELDDTQGVKTLDITDELHSNTNYSWVVRAYDITCGYESVETYNFVTEYIYIPNTAPVAVDDYIYITTQKWCVINVLSNDYDSDSDFIDGFSIDIITEPLFGEIEIFGESSDSALNPRQKIKYYPNPGFTGNDYFSYTIKDMDGMESNIADVNIKVGMKIDTADLIVTNYDRDTINILTGVGDGTFVNDGKFNINGSSRDSAVGDFNLDGKNDIVVGNWDNDSIVLLYGDGHNNFTFAAEYRVGEIFFTQYRPDLTDSDYDNDAHPKYLYSGDFNHDGWLDVLVSDYGETECRGGNPDNLPWEDDGSISVLINDGAGKFLDRNVYTNEGARCIGDFDNDGFIDFTSTKLDTGCVTIVEGDGSTTTSCNHKTYLYFGNGEDWYPFDYGGKIPGAYIGQCTGDFDGDGNLDIAGIESKHYDDDWDLTSAASADMSVVIFFGNGSGDFNVRTHHYDNIPYVEMQQYAKYAGHVGDGISSFYSMYRISSGANKIKCGDFDNDGDLDLVTAHSYGENELNVLINNGSGVFIEGDLWTGSGDISSSRKINFLPEGGSSDWRDVVVYDFNSDSNLDLATANARSGSVSILLGDGAGDFNLLDTIGVGGSPYSLSIVDTNPALSDLNCIGDLVWSNVEPGSSLTGSFIVRNVGEVDLDWEVLTVPSWGDFDISPLSGLGLGPDEELTVDVSITAPSEYGQTKSGVIRVISSSDPGDYSEINVLISTKPSPTQNNPPEAVDETVRTNVSSSVIIDILDNDQDSDGFIVESSVNIVDDPVNGIIDEINTSTGEVTYNPDTGFSGIDSFTYTVRDDDNAISNIATVTVVVGDENYPAIIHSIVPYDTETDVSVDLSELSVYISDPEGDSFNWNIVCSNGDSSTGTGEFNGTKTCPISNLIYNTVYIWYVNVTDSGSGITVNYVFSFATVNVHSEAPIVNITRPERSSFYFMNKFRRNISLPFSIIIGGIDLEAEVGNPYGCDISNISFYIDDILLDTFDYNSSKTSYGITWDEKTVGMVIISVVLQYDDGMMVSDELDLFMINLDIL